MKQSKLDQYFAKRKCVTPSNKANELPSSDTNNLSITQNNLHDQSDQSFNSCETPPSSCDQGNNNSETVASADENGRCFDSCETSSVVIVEPDRSSDNIIDITMSTDDENDQNDGEIETLNPEGDQNFNNSEDNTISNDENDQSFNNSEEPETSMVCDVDPKLVSDVQNLSTHKNTVKKNKGVSGTNNTAAKLKIELEFLDTTIKQSDSVKHLLNAESQKFLENWEGLGEDGKKIVSYLFWREQHLDRINLIQHGGQAVLRGPRRETVKELLLQKGFIISAPSKGEVKLDLETYVQQLSLRELKRICKSLKINPLQKTKSSIENALKAYNVYRDTQYNTVLVFKRLKSSFAACHKLSDSARNTFKELIVLMHLGILGMDRSEDPTKKITSRPSSTIKADIIAKSYPVPKDMKVDDASILFHNRDEFLRYLQAYDDSEKYFSLRLSLSTKLLKEKKAIKRGQNAYDKLKEQEDVNKIKEEMKRIILETSESYENLKNKRLLRYTELRPWLWRFMPENIYLEIIDDGVELLKTQKQYRYAVKLLDLLIEQKSFKQYKKGEFYKDKTNILHNYLKDDAEVSETLLEVFKADISDDVKSILRPLASKLSKKREIPDHVRRELRDFLNKSDINELELNNDKVEAGDGNLGDAKGRPELNCIKYYKRKEGFPNGEHFEEKLMPTMFSLLFWDIIYTKPMGVVGIFMSHYQQHPLDMFSEEFYVNRKMKINERLTTIATSSAEEIIEMMQEARNKSLEYDVSVVNRKVEWEHLAGVTRCLGGKALAAICGRLAHNYNYVYWGLPDLILWDVETKRIKFREVKTKRDTLRLKQWQWLKFLKAQGLDAGVCYLLP